MTHHDAIDIAARRFPVTFGLSAFPGETFRISRSSSYVADLGAVMLYTERLCDDGEWHSFAKGPPAELLRSLTSAPTKGGVK